MSDATFWTGRRVLVTGHTGFKGSWLTLWLHALGARVSGIALPPTGRSLFVDADVASACESRAIDIRDADALETAIREIEPDIVFHLAAQALVRPSYAAAADTWSTNVMGTIHLLDALRAVDRVRAVVVVTSDKCYEQGGPPRPFVEDDPLGGHDPYSASKAAAEVAVASWRRSFFAARGVGLATARAGNVIGGGDWADDRLIPDLVRSIGSAHEVSIRSPQATRPWQHVLEPLGGYLTLAERLFDEPLKFAGAWNFGPSGDPLAVHWMAELFTSAMGDWPVWRSEPDDSIHEARHLSLSIAKAERQLHWSPRLTIDEAIAWTADVYRAAIDHRDQRGQRAVVRRQIDAYRRLSMPEPAIAS